ncbi:hypothetical protein ABS71_07680 [bacterium SCN 62-11]|nr:MAG: hypothetical protein ABS71_07680 [bacterium SCN 62-11]
MELTQRFRHSSWQEAEAGLRADEMVDKVEGAGGGSCAKFLDCLWSGTVQNDLVNQGLLR